MVKKMLPTTYPDQLRLAEEIALLRFKTTRPTTKSRIYVTWPVVKKFFDVKLGHMKQLVGWLQHKGEAKNLVLTSKLRSRKAVPIRATRTVARETQRESERNKENSRQAGRRRPGERKERKERKKD